LNEMNDVIMKQPNEETKQNYFEKELNSNFSKSKNDDYQLEILFYCYMRIKELELVQS